MANSRPSRNIAGTGRVRCSLICLLSLSIPGSSFCEKPQAAMAIHGTEVCQKQVASDATNKSERYHLQYDDTMALTFPLAPEYSAISIVQPDGYISLTNASPVFVQGLTLAEAKDAVITAYKGVLHDPMLEIDLKDVQKPSYTVLGQVMKPGRYDIRYETTLAEGMAVAGGLMPTAKTQVFLFRRVTCSDVRVTEFNLRRVLEGKNPSDVPTLKPGDMVFVPEKFIAHFRKYLPFSTGLSVTPYPGAF